MVESSIQEIAADISLISIALLGVSFILTALAWKGFNELFVSLPRDERRELVKRYFIPFIPVLITVSIVTAVGVEAPELVQLSYLLVMLGFGVISILYLIFYSIQRLFYFIMRRKKERKAIKVDSATGYYFASLVILAISIFCSVFALFGVIFTALDINISPNQTNDFLFAKWLLADAVLFFTFGVFITAWAYLYDKSRSWKKGDREEVTNKE